MHRRRARPLPFGSAGTSSNAREVVTITGFATGGDGVARLGDGRAVFVPGALTQDRVTIRLRSEHGRFARGEIVAIEEPSPFRRDPPCPEVARGCGGCGWQHVAIAQQREAKLQIVTDALARIGRVQQPLVQLGPTLAEAAFRTTIRVGIVGGRAAFRRARGTELVAVSGCWVADPRLSELLREGRFDGATEVTLRLGVATGERLALVDPMAFGTVLPGDVDIVGLDEFDRRDSPDSEAHYHEIVAGRTWRVSARSFFQTRADGAEALVECVARTLRNAGTDRPQRLIDAYGGVGLLTAAAPGAGHVTVVEESASSAADACNNLADRDVAVVTSSIQRWQPEPAEVVVADPARAGLGAEAVAVLAGTSAETIVLVSCDAGSLGRDAGMLAACGYRHCGSEVLDLFPHTPHVEVVTLFQK